MVHQTRVEVVTCPGISRLEPPRPSQRSPYLRDGSRPRHYPFHMPRFFCIQLKSPTQAIVRFDTPPGDLVSEGRRPTKAESSAETHWKARWRADLRMESRHRETAANSRQTQRALGTTKSCPTKTA